MSCYGKLNCCFLVCVTSILCIYTRLNFGKFSSMHPEPHSLRWRLVGEEAPPPPLVLLESMVIGSQGEKVRYVADDVPSIEYCKYMREWCSIQALAFKLQGILVYLSRVPQT
ncbi:unnamed protein product [Ectocarpus fasciculatus]